jgi:hypothetical protein
MHRQFSRQRLLLGDPPPLQCLANPRTARARITGIARHLAAGCQAQRAPDGS